MLVGSRKMHLCWTTWGLKMLFRPSAHWPTNWKSLICNTGIVSVEPLISEMSRSLNMNLYMRAFSVAISQKFDLHYLSVFRIFFWSANCTVLVCKLCLLFQTILDLWPVLILEIFSSWDIKKGQFQFLVTFLAVFFWSVNCTLGLWIRSLYHHIYWTWAMFYLRVFSN